MAKKAKPKGRAEAVRAKPVDSPLGYVEGPPGLTDPHAFGLVVDGDSMQPEYRPGEVVIFSRAASITSGDDCWVVFLHPAWGLCERLKRVFLEPDGSIRMEALNRKYGSLTVEAWRVLAVIRAVAKAPAGVRDRPCPAHLERVTR